MAASGSILPVRTKIGFGLGSIGYGIKDNGFATFLLFYYNQVVGLRADLVSLAIALALIADAFIDPMVGQFSDRTRTKIGRRHPWLYGAIIPIVVAWIFLWHPPDASETFLFFYLLFVAMAVRMAFSCYEVPALALLPELSSDYHDRTAIMRYRYLFGWGGGLGIMFLAYAVFLVPDANNKVGLLNRGGYEAYAILGAAVMLVTVLLSAAATHRRIVRKYHAEKQHSAANESLSHMAAALRYRPFLLLMFAGVFSFTNQWLVFALSPYLYSHVWLFSQANFEAISGLLLIAAFTAFLIVTPISRRFGKAKTASTMILIALLLGNMPYLLRMLDVFPSPGDAMMIPLLFGLLISSTAASISAMILTLSMIADVSDQYEHDTSRKSEGVFASGMFFMQKVVNGIGILLSGLIIAFIGLPEGAEPGKVAPEILDNFVLIFLILSTTIAFIGAWAYRLFPLGEKEHEERMRSQNEGAGPETGTKET